MSARTRLLWVTAGMTICGVAGSIWGHLLPWEFAQHLVHDLSVALFVAGLLAVSVDRFFKSEFSRDAFQAAFSYVLPDELKAEVRRVINYKFICTKHHMVLKLTHLGENKDLVRLEISIERTLRNVSRSPENIRNSFAVDEWGFSAMKSGIDECKMEFGSKVLTSKPRKDVGADAIGMETAEIKIKHDEEVTVVSKGYEIKHTNAEFIIDFRHPTVDPVVEISPPTGFNHSFGFGVPDEDVRKSSLFERYELNGTQFPGQSMRLRWWPTE